MTTSSSPVQNPVLAQALLGASAGNGTVGAAQTIEDRFLALLVAQMKYQDPLQPMDNAQVTTQIAQINTVAGIDKLNQTLQQMSASFTGMQSLQATSLIGRGILAAGTQLQLTASGAMGGVNLSDSADSVVVSVADAAGRVLEQMDLGPQKAGTVAFHWDGQGPDGAMAPGNYVFSVKALRAGKPVQADALGYGQVQSVTLGTGGVQVDAQGLGQVDFSAIRQIVQ